MVKCTKSTEPSDFSKLRHVRSPAWGSPETSNTRKFSRMPLSVVKARLLTGVISSSSVSTDSSIMFLPPWGTSKIKRPSKPGVISSLATI